MLLSCSRLFLAELFSAATITGLLPEVIIASSSCPSFL
jgi:hypothetical protein